MEEERDVAGPADGATVEADVGVTETAGWGKGVEAIVAAKGAAC